MSLLWSLIDNYDTWYYAVKKSLETKFISVTNHGQFPDLSEKIMSYIDPRVAIYEHLPPMLPYVTSEVLDKDIIGISNQLTNQTFSLHHISCDSFETDDKKQSVEGNLVHFSKYSYLMTFDEYPCEIQLTKLYRSTSKLPQKNLCHIIFTIQNKSSLVELYVSANSHHIVSKILYNQGQNCLTINNCIGFHGNMLEENIWVKTPFHLLPIIYGRSLTRETIFLLWILLRPIHWRNQETLDEFVSVVSHQQNHWSTLLTISKHSICSESIPQFF